MQTQVIESASQIQKIILKHYHRNVASFPLCNNLWNGSDQIIFNRIPPMLEVVLTGLFGVENHLLISALRLHRKQY